ncbi:MAG: hypothetical protein HC780_14060, partial [Leptolyngbyaceae cyanobacterium CSU_1_3]|nr:hypothetical protein [Leptolyngbyaceae cyanobacterium CSU_1_3]
MSGLLLLNLTACSSQPTVISHEPPEPGAAPVKLVGKISEVSPPAEIQALRQALEKYQPQVTIVAPQANEILQDDTVTVRLQVKDLPLYKDEDLGLGSHLYVFLDSQPYQPVYDTNAPLIFNNLTPGTHTLRVFAGRPWHESFKNEGAYAQTTFHVFTKTPDQNPNPELPLLTYSRPQGTYGAEPIMLDFYLTNAPLHLIAQEDQQDDVVDWRIKVTVNGESFLIDRWQPLYLKGFKPGKNWVQLEYIDEQGNALQNVYNNTAHVFTYEPNGQDTLSKLIRGDLSASQARRIVDPNYQPETLVPEPSPPSEPTPKPSPIPSTPIVPNPQETPIPEVKPTIEPTPKTEPATEPKIPTTPKEPKGFFDRFRRPAETPKPSLDQTPQPSPIETPTLDTQETPIPEIEPTIEPTPKTEPAIEPKIPTTPKEPKGFFDRFRRPAETPKPSLDQTPQPSPIETPTLDAEEVAPGEKTPELPA